MGKAETRLTEQMTKDGYAVYGHERIVIVKYHGNEYSRGGVSDLLICLDGAFGACEVKAPESYGGSVERALDSGPSVRQQAFIRKVLDANGVAWVAATREQFLDGLAEMDRRNRERCIYCNDYSTDPEVCDSCPIHSENTPARLA